jgi:hypothetical protein
MKWSKAIISDKAVVGRMKNLVCQNSLLSGWTVGRCFQNHLLQQYFDFDSP